jgi:hypothetical protein
LPTELAGLNPERAAPKLQQCQSDSVVDHQASAAITSKLKALDLPGVETLVEILASSSTAGSFSDLASIVAFVNTFTSEQLQLLWEMCTNLIHLHLHHGRASVFTSPADISENAFLPSSKRTPLVSDPERHTTSCV